MLECRSRTVKNAPEENKATKQVCVHIYEGKKGTVKGERNGKGIR